MIFEAVGVFSGSFGHRSTRIQKLKTSLLSGRIWVVCDAYLNTGACEVEIQITGGTHALSALN